MPRTHFDALTRDSAPLCVPSANYLAELFGRYRRAARLTTDDLGALLGISGAAVRRALSKPAAAWSVADLARYSAALRCPLDDALEAVKRSVE